MKECEINKSEIEKYLNILENVELFKTLPRKALKKLQLKMRQVNILGGEVLIQEGDCESTAYILIYGRLRVTKKSKESLFDHVISDISPGEIVGEICFLTEENRTATVFATRDSVLLKISKKDYEEFASLNLEVAYHIAKTAAIRLVQQLKPNLPRDNICTIAIAPAGNSDHLEFAKLLHKDLSKNYKCCLVDIQLCNDFFHRDMAKFDSINKYNQLIVKWIESIEKENDFVLFITDRQMTPWSEKCIRGADHVFFLADTTVHPALNSIEIKYFANTYTKYQISDLILVHPKERSKISGTINWLKDREVNDFFHINLSSSLHMKKLVRILTGNAIGVVLNGGGARGFAHLGVIKALQEQQIPIDFIAGASMGALQAGGWALVGYEALRCNSLDFAKNYHPDYTFPFIALTKGNRLTSYYKKWFEDNCIEDLWTNFFCVSCNLSKANIKIHREGKLYKALRATTSIPAIFPPIFEENGDILIDGSVIDNMPVRLLRQRMKGGKIIAVNCCSSHKHISDKPYSTPSASGWKLLLNSIIHNKKDDVEYHNIIKVILSSIHLASSSYETTMAQEADYYIEIDTNKFGPLDFHSLEEIEEEGYKTAIKIISELDVFS